MRDRTTGPEGFAASDGQSQLGGPASAAEVTDGNGNRACVVFDLTAVEFMDSSVIAFLLWTAKQVDAVRVRSPSPLVRRVLDAMGLTGTLVVES